MKSELFVEAVGDIDDAFVQRASQSQAKVVKFEWVKWVAVAACLGVAVLIAVPALKGQTPEVEPEPVEPTPIEAPVVEPEAEPVEEPADEPTPSDDQMAGWAAGSGFWKDQTDYTSLEEFLADIDDPVFEAFVDTEEAQQHSFTYHVLTTPNAYVGDDGKVHEDGQLVQVLLYCHDYDTPIITGDQDYLQVTSYNYERTRPNFDDPIFGDTESYFGTQTTYEVDGVTVEKTSGGISRTISERIYINGLWYYVEGTVEDDVETLAAALARIANEI